MNSGIAPALSPPKASLNVVFICAAAFFVDYMAYAMMVPLTPVSPAGITCGADETIVVFAYSLGLLITSLNITRVFRHLPHRSQMLLGVSTLTVAVCLIGCATHLSIYVVGRVFQGASAAVTSIAGYSAVARTYPHARVRMMGAIFCSASGGFVLGPVFGGYLYDLGGYGLPFLCLGLPLALLASAQWLGLASHRLEGNNRYVERNTSRADAPAETPYHTPSGHRKNATSRVKVSQWRQRASVWPATRKHHPRHIGTVFCTGRTGFGHCR